MRSCSAVIWEVEALLQQRRAAIARRKQDLRRDAEAPRDRCYEGGVEPSFKRSSSVSIFARHAGRILLAEDPRVGMWLPVGGELQAGETPLRAARRLLLEETGLSGIYLALPGAIDG